MVTGLKILDRIGTHRCIIRLFFYSGKKYNFMHFERYLAFQNALKKVFQKTWKKSRFHQQIYVWSDYPKHNVCFFLFGLIEKQFLLANISWKKVHNIQILPLFFFGKFISIFLVRNTWASFKNLSYFI